MSLSSADVAPEPQAGPATSDQSLRPTLPVQDLWQRPMSSLRLSVTDRCNLRCTYCMPETNYRWLPRPHLLTFEELTTVTRAFVHLGVTRVRITGGEPLLRQDLPTLVAQLAAIEGIDDLALTTNATLLADQAQALQQAGLKRLTVSLDTLNANDFQALTGRDDFAKVQQGLATAQAAGFDGRIKLNTVVIAGTNDHQLGTMLRFAARHNVEVRFIEYMDVGGATRWHRSQVVSQQTMLRRIGADFGPPKPLRGRGAAPSQRYQLPSGQVFGIIGSTTEPFCNSCDRSRITADGQWLLCLYQNENGTDLRALLRSGASAQTLAQHIAQTWQQRNHRGAMERPTMQHRQPLVQLPTLRQRPHLEMHTRGG